MQSDLLLVAMPINRPQRRFWTTQRRQMMLQATSLVLDFLRGAHTKLAQDWNWWAPPLQGVLQKKPLDNEGHEQPAAVFRQTQRQT